MGIEKLDSHGGIIVDVDAVVSGIAEITIFNDEASLRVADMKAVRSRRYTAGGARTDRDAAAL